MESSSEVSEPSEFSDTNDPTHPHPPSSAAPHSPSLPPQDDGAPLTVSKAFWKAVEMSQHLRKGPENDVGDEWVRYCELYGTENVFEAFKHFLNTHRVDNGRPISTFTWRVPDLIKEMQQHKASALASVATTDEDIGNG